MDRNRLMSANQLIDLLEEQGLLAPEVIVELRRNVAQSKTRITHEGLAKLLVENGQLTRFQATRLVAQIQESPEAHPTDPRPFSTPLSPPKLPVASDELDLLPEEVGSVSDPNNPVEAKLIPDDEIIEAVEIIEEEEKKPENKKRNRESIDTPSRGTATRDFGGPTESPTFVRPVKIAAPKGHSWDAFRIWGVGFILSVLLAALSWLVYWVMSGSSAQFYEQAQEAYESRDYEVAVERFTAFAKKFSKEEKASAAKSFAAIATIRQAVDQLGDPALAIEKAEAILPTIVNEPSMGDTGIRSDLASALVSVAEKLLQRADHAKTTPERKELIGKLDKHLVLMGNPQYIPNANRVTNESRIKAIEEERERILRDVQREEDLVSATEKMTAAIEKADVQGAYQARRAVTRKYPQLALEPKLLELLQQATSLQQKAVKTAEENPQSFDTQTEVPVGKSVLLFKQSGAKANVANDMVLFVKAKGSIYGLRATDGHVLWRRNVGIESVSEPLRLSSDPGSDCLIVVPSQNRLARLSSQDGNSQWEVNLGSPILHPSVEGDTIYIATADGRAYALDASTGQAKWGKRLPQTLNVGMGGGSSKSSRFVVGDHSNIYVLSRKDGSCTGVFYLGHEMGTIAVPPVYALGQLMVFQNVTANTCEVKVLKATDDPGSPIEVIPANAAPLKGHVVIPPSLDGRRMVVMTDLGETAAFDIEPASSAEKLNRVANIVANETQPKVAWPLVVGNELWITSSRFSRFQIQVSKQKLVPDWVREDEDAFTSRPFKMDDYIVHTRIVRGTQGIRVSAARADTGDPVWETDLGVPIAAIQGTSEAIAAISSQAALYALDAAKLGSGKPTNASENPGRNQRSMQFSSPALLPNGKLAMLNLHQGNQVALYDPTAAPGASLLVNRLQIGTATPSAEPLNVGNALVVPLDNSQLAYIDPTNGKSLGAPFQPTLTVGVNTQWLAPALLSDKQTVVAATDQKALYRLSSGKQLKELSQVTTAARWVQRLAAVGDTVCGVARGDAQDMLQFYHGTDLSRLDEVDVDGRVTWGPYALGEQFLAHSETSGIVALVKAGKPMWKTPLAQISLVGSPVLQGDDILINATTGSMFRIELATGKLKATVRIGEPLSGPPFVFGNVLLFPGSEGVLTAVPTSKTQSNSSEVDAL